MKGTIGVNPTEIVLIRIEWLPVVLTRHETAVLLGVGIGIGVGIDWLVDPDSDTDTDSDPGGSANPRLTNALVSK
jgi:hypothetical protein